MVLSRRGKEAPFYLERCLNKELSPIRRGKDCYVQCDRVELAVGGEIQPESRNIMLDEDGNIVLNQPYKDQYYNGSLIGTDIIDLGDDRYYHPLAKIVTDSGSNLCLDLLEKRVSSVSSKGICVYNSESGYCEMWDRNGVLLAQTESPLYYFGEHAIVRKSDTENRIGYYAHRQGGGEEWLCAEDEMFYLSEKHGLIGCREGEDYVLKNAAGETILSLDEQPEKNSIEVIPMLGYTVFQIGERLYAAEGGLTSQQSVWNMALYQDFLYIKEKGTLVGYPEML